MAVGNGFLSSEKLALALAGALASLLTSLYWGLWGRVDRLENASQEQRVSLEGRLARIEVKLDRLVSRR
jgi:hypothetical protein